MTSSSDIETLCPKKEKNFCLQHGVLVFCFAMLCATIVLCTLIGKEEQTQVLNSDPTRYKSRSLLPPPFWKFPEMARYVVHVSDWAALSTISTHEGIENYPFNNVFSMSDGTLGNSTGVPYFYLTELELSVADLNQNPRASLTASLAQSGFCDSLGLDPQSPLCAHVILTGEIVRIQPESEEEDRAQQALFSRHPVMETWPAEHGWFFAKLEIRHIYLLDIFGGAKSISVEDYFSAEPPM